MNVKDLLLLKWQHDFLIDTEHKYLAAICGYGAGKSITLAYKAIYLASLNAGYEGAVMSPTFPMLMDVMVKKMQEACGKISIRYTFEKAAKKFILHWPGGKSTLIHLMAAENWDRNAGYELAFACLDEMDRIDRDDAHEAWKMMCSRLRKGRVFQICAVSTPKGYNFCYDFWYKDARNEKGEYDPERRIIHASNRENPFLKPDYIPNLLKTHSPKECEALIDGKFVNMTSGSVYYTFDRELSKTAKTLAEFPNAILNIGVDFNVGNTSATVGVVDGKGGVIYIVDEFVGCANSEDLVAKITRKYPNRRIIYYPDSAGNASHSNSSFTDIQILHRTPNCDIKYHPKSPPIKDRVGSVNARIKNGLGERRLFVNTTTCPKLTDSLEQQAYDDFEKPSKSGDLDHIVDALGYFIYYRYPIKGSASVRAL